MTCDTRTFLADGPASVAHHCVRAATLVNPRVTLEASLKRTKTRFTAGSNVMALVASTNTPYVGVWPGAISRVTLAAGRLLQTDVTGSVSQIRSVTGSVAVPVPRRP